MKVNKTYFIHDNRARPFKVIINNNEVSIYKKINENLDDYNKLIKTYKVTKIFIGKDSKNKKLNGNSILLQINDNKMVCITDLIFEFELAKDDKIIKYFSIVGNNDVPYPVLLGEKYFYSMIEKEYCLKNEFPLNYKIKDFEDGHTYFYGTFDNKKGWVSPIKIIKKLPKLRIIYKRIL